MRLQRASTGQTILLREDLLLASGGEARIFAVPREPLLVAKVYHKPSGERAHKLAIMLAKPPLDPMAAQGHISIAWPTDLLSLPRASSRVVGFVMPRVTGLRAIIDYFNPKSRRTLCPLFSYLYLHRTALNLVKALRAIHERGYIIGDLNELNILVAETALVTFVDTDSFQVADAARGVTYRCRVGKPEFTPPELQGVKFVEQDRQLAHDYFGLGVLLFQLLMEGTHPFAGRYRGRGDPPPYEERIRAGHFPHVPARGLPYTPSPAAPQFDWLAPRLQDLFIRCFHDGHLDPTLRPDTLSWQYALEESEKTLVTCVRNPQHLHSPHVAQCPWCERTHRLGGRDPFPAPEEVQHQRHLLSVRELGRATGRKRGATGGPRIPVPPPIPPPGSRRGSQAPTGGKRPRWWASLVRPRAHNNWAYLAFSLGLLGGLMAYLLNLEGKSIPPGLDYYPGDFRRVAVALLGLSGMLSGVGGILRAASPKVDGAGRWIAVAGIGLGFTAMALMLF